MALKDLKPHKVSKDLKGYSVMFYGAPKSGKTTIASQFPGAVLFAFEKGYSALPGVFAEPLYNWNEFKKALRELEDPETKAMFQTVVIDTADIAYGYCCDYVCSQASDATHDYDNIGDIPYGGGYRLAQNEFDKCLRRILNLDYGLVIISHSQEKTQKDTAGNEYSQIVPTLDNKARIVCERTCDIIGYSRGVANEEGQIVTKLFLRGNQRFVAGSRFKYTPDVIDFTYDNLVNAIADAIDKEAQTRGASAVTEEKEQLHIDGPTYDFDAQMKEFQSIVGGLMETGSPKVSQEIVKIVEEHLGKGKKVGECTAANAPQLDLILFDLKHLADSSK